jgi:hypothetical protein
MAPDLSRLFPHNFIPLTDNTITSPFFKPTAAISPSALKDADLAAPTSSLPNNAY